MFSQRTNWNRDPNRLTSLVAAARAEGRDLVDLTCSNPTECGFVYDADLCGAIAEAGSQSYRPESLGLASARIAVCDYYARAGTDVTPEHTWLAAGTSELYAHLFWLLCDPGDAVLVPRPGYPLFDYLADLAGVKLVPYEVRYDGAWHVDLAGLREAVTSNARLKAIVSVSPNNPVGHYLSAEECEACDCLCREHQLAHVIDEVFCDYPLLDELPAPAHRALERATCLTFLLSGLSKVAALPQMKLSWAVGVGPGSEQAMQRLELINDVFLSAATPVQRALPAIIEACPGMQQRIRIHCRENFARLREVFGNTPVTVLDAEGGWTALIRLPAVDGMDDAAWAETLLREEDVLVQPGYLFDLGFVLRAPCLAISLLTPKGVMERGLQAILRSVTRHALQ